MSTSIKISDFSFTPSGYGHFLVTYTSPVTGKSWETVTSNTQLIDATKNSDDPTQVNLKRLKNLCKDI